MQKRKILVIRMLGFGDVACVGIPALRYLQAKHPSAEFHFLSFAAGKELIKLAEPDVHVFGLDKGQWPDQMLPAMEVFLELAAPVVEHKYSHIYNFDTWFMPCFLARFLKDIGLNVRGNTLAKSIDQVLAEFENKTLTPDFVNNPANYMLSDWVSMQAWHTPWWTGSHCVAGGYPEFYLRHCCGFTDIQMDMTIAKFAMPPVKSKRQPVIALATQARTQERNYPHGDKLQTLLKQKGYRVWTGFDGAIPLRATLDKLGQSDLLITVPSAPQWLAKAVNTPAMVISGQVDPRTLMPDFTLPMSKDALPPEQIVEAVEQALK